MKKPSTPIINHFTALISFDNFQDSIDELEKFATLITDKLNFNVVAKNSHAFKSKGKTLVYILSESHLILHTWPEYKLIHIDLVSCTNLTIEEFKDALTSIFQNQENCKIKIKECNF